LRYAAVSSAFEPCVNFVAWAAAVVSAKKRRHKIINNPESLIGFLLVTG